MGVAHYCSSTFTSMKSILRLVLAAVAAGSLCSCVTVIDPVCYDTPGYRQPVVCSRPQVYHYQEPYCAPVRYRPEPSCNYYSRPSYGGYGGFNDASYGGSYGRYGGGYSGGYGRRGYSCR